MAHFISIRDLPITEKVFIKTLSITNFRRLDDLALDLDGHGIVLTGANGAGKTSLLTAIAGALGRRVPIAREDFADLAEPIEVRVVLGGLVPAHQRVFGDRVTLSGGGGAAQLAVGLLARWDEDAERVDTRCGFPSSAWQSLSRLQRESLPVLWLPSWRDPARLLSLTASTSVLSDLLRQLELGEASAAASGHLNDAIAALTSAPALATTLDQIGTQLGQLLPDVRAGAFQLLPGSRRDLWESLRLAVEHEGPSVDVRVASSGLAQAAVFAVLLQALAGRERIVLVDEPELFLHPSAQRAVVRRLEETATQLIVATHSSSVLDRVDVRRIARLAPVDAGVIVRQPYGVDDVDARRYARLVDPRSSEAVFARKVVLVEGASDRLALLEVCATLGIDVDARGVVVLALDGAAWITTAMRVYGPQGLSVPLLGLVDADHEQRWADELTTAGLPARSRDELAGRGFHVCDPYLEPVLLDALGEDAVEQVVAADGDAGRLERFVRQPAHANAPRRDQLLAFIKKDKTRWAPLLAADLPATAETPLHDLARRL